MKDKRRLAKKALIKFLVALWTWKLIYPPGIYQTKNKTIFVYIDSLDEFAAAVEQLCIAEPNKILLWNIKNLWWKELTTKHESQRRYSTTKQNFNITMFSDAKLFEKPPKENDLGMAQTFFDP